MTPAMNAGRDGTMDWFFDQWVHGTHVPVLEADLDVDRKSGQYRIHGTVTVADVPDDFKLLVPLWLDFGDGRMVRFGQVPMIGPGTQEIDVTTELPERPKEALVNARWEILARDG